MQQVQRVVRHGHGEIRLLPTMTNPSGVLVGRRGYPSIHAIDLANLDENLLQKHSDMFVQPNRRPFYVVAKRMMDVVGALVGLLLLSPLILVISLFIKLESPGAVIFQQVRVGKDGRKFRLFKFRTMCRDAEELKNSKEIQQQNMLKWPDFKIENDPRATRIGRILRKFSLDEIPSFINVLRGDMSLVGPRPTSFHEDKYDEWHKLRLKATPGITGLHQVSGRSDLQFDERVRLDIAYINRQSLALDLKIMLKTAAAIYHHNGAY